MKKKISAVLVVVVFLTVYMSLGSNFNKITMQDNSERELTVLYSADGRELIIYSDETELYKTEGWYEDKEGIISTLYSTDGRTMEVPLTKAEEYRALGWYINKSEVTRILYSPDGREITVFLDDIETYKGVGWYETKEAVTTELTALDGRKITVYNSQVQDYINAGWFKERNVQIDPSKPMLALTYDDGPKAATTEKILNVLEKYNASATFFVLGNMAEKNTDILRKMDILGCQIGNHSYSHSNLTELSEEDAAQEINKTSNIVYSAVKKHTAIVRPPYGAYNDRVLSVINKPFILWTVDTLDWKYKNADYVVKEVLAKANDGSIILMHDIYDSTAEATARLVPELISRGYQLVTIEEMAHYRDIPLNAGKVYGKFK